MMPAIRMVGLLLSSLLCANHAIAAGDEIEELDATAAADAADPDQAAPLTAADLMGATTDCISTRRISRTEIIGDQAIIFYMDGNVTWLNRLPYRCPRLRSADAFSYTIRGTSQLCHIDTIRVVDTFGVGGGVGAACALGRFNELSDAQVSAIREFGWADD